MIGHRPDVAPTRAGVPVDLRLAGAAITGWAAVLWGLGRAAGTVGLVAAIMLLAAVLALGLGHRPWSRVVAFLLATAALLLAPLAVRLDQARDGPLAALARQRTPVTAELRVDSDPKPIAAHGTSGSPRSAVDGSLIAVWLAGQRVPLSGAVLVLGPSEGWRGVLPGQRVQLAGRLEPPLTGDLLTAVLSAQGNPELLGRPPPWQRAAGAVRAGLQRASAGLPTLVRGLLPGLVDGDTSQLDPVLANSFRVAGLTHLVAVSGTNCAILVGTVALLLRRLRASPRTIALLGGLVLVGFVIVARPSASVLRAAVMAAIALAALAGGRQRAGLPLLAGSTLLLLLWRPNLAVDLGFALSVAATAALLVIAPGWAEALGRRWIPAGLAEPVAVAAAAHLVTAPLIVAISGRLSLVAIPANVLAEPVVAAATVLGVLAAVTSVLWLPAAVLFAQLAGWPCRWLVWVAEHFSGLPGAALPWPSGLAGGGLLGLLTVVGWWLCRWPGPRRLIAGAVVVALLVQIPVRSVVLGWPPPGWLIVACDVGQGDALVLNAGAGAAVVIDAGPDPVPVDRCLRELRVDRLPLVVLSHFHLDHVGGLPGVLHQRAVGQVLGSPLADPVSGVRLVNNALASRGLRVQPVVVGSTLTSGAVRLEVLGPVRNYHDTHSDPNNSSVVLRATVAGVRILLPGDAEVEAQDDLLAAGTDLRADILKVPHHGSAFSDASFLGAVHARVALISVGRHNDYGHPSPLLLAELARLGLPVGRTDLDGDIAVTVRSGALVPVSHQTRTGNASGPGRVRIRGDPGQPPSDRTGWPAKPVLGR
jgi:competence protein ComEC